MWLSVRLSQVYVPSTEHNDESRGIFWEYLLFRGVSRLAIPPRNRKTDFEITIRMDVINLISKDQRFPDAEPSLGPGFKYHPGGKYFVNGPRMHEYLQEIKQKVLQKHGAVTVGEMPGVSDIDEIIRTVGRKNGELNMIFIFDVVDIDNVPGKVRMTLQEWSVKDLARVISKWQRAMYEHDGWNSVFVENHDNPRSVSRYCNDSDRYREFGATLLALMQTTLSGTLFVYQGEELGMRNVCAFICPSIYPFTNRKTFLRGEQWFVLNTALMVTILIQLTFRVGKLTLSFDLGAEVMGHR